MASSRAFCRPARSEGQVPLTLRVGKLLEAGDEGSMSAGVVSSRNQKNVWGARVSKYGASVIGGNPEQLHGNGAGPVPEIQVHDLSKAREVGHGEDALLLPGPGEGQDPRVVRAQKLNRPLPEGWMALTEGDETLHPRQV